METPYLCPSEGHKHGRRDVRKHLELNFAINSDYFWLMIYYTFTQTALSTLRMFNLQKWKGKAFFESKQLCHGTQLDITYTGGELEYSKCSVFKTNGTTKLKICKRYIFNLSYT